ncbi:hypothetical protein [Metabacillus idriensis]|nr:hypothetical protein [Metabacillus idriensis]
MKKDEEKRKVNSDDGWNRTFYGSPTICGFIVVGILVAYILYQWLFN